MTDWVNFALGEDIRTEARRLQDEIWAEAETDGRRHVSARELTILHRNEALYGIQTYYCIVELLDALRNRLNPFLLSIIIDYAYPAQGEIVFSILSYHEVIRNHMRKPRPLNTSLFQIYVRKRPLQPFERMNGCYDSCNVMENMRSLILHDCSLAYNGRLLNMTHKSYIFDKVFNEYADNDIVCGQTMAPLLKNVFNMNNSTLLCFGQTGTGKTYTMNGALQYLSSALRSASIELTFFEIHGKKCYDLLSRRKVVHLRCDENDELHVRGAVSKHLTVHSPEDFMTVVQEALTLRSSEVTERNPISSRSHAVCMIKIQSDKTKSEDSQGGKLTIVDLAGSERNYETVQMTAAQHRESAEINFTLMCLKDCFRAYHAHINTSNNSSLTNNKVSKLPRIPFRGSLLTRVLRECFSINHGHKTTIMATISPSPIDIVHSINTLDHVSLMSPTLQQLSSSVTVEVPKHMGVALSDTPVFMWTADQVIAWLATAEKGRFAHIVVPPGITGDGLLQLNSNSLAGLFAGDIRAARQEDEGTAWTIEGEAERHVGIAKALWAALRLENQSALLKYSNKIHL